MNVGSPFKPIEILLVEDNPGNVRLTQEALKDAKMRNNVHIARDGGEAISFLRRQGEYTQPVRPDLILLDLNLPRISGREVLEVVKGDCALRTTPSVVLTSSKAEPKCSLPMISTRTPTSRSPSTSADSLM